MVLVSIDPSSSTYSSPLLGVPRSPESGGHSFNDAFALLCSLGDIKRISADKEDELVLGCVCFESSNI